MNMKKKSLVAGLLAVSLAAQPVAATIAPKAVHAADKAVNMVKLAQDVQKIVYNYKNGNGSEGVKNAEEEFTKLTEAKKAIVKAEADKEVKAWIKDITNEIVFDNPEDAEYKEITLGGKGTSDIYELIVEEYNKENSATLEEKLAAEKLALQVIEIAKIEVKDNKVVKKEIELSFDQAEKIYNLLRKEDEKIVDYVYKYAGKNENGNPLFEGDNISSTNVNSGAVIDAIHKNIEEEANKLNVNATLEGAVDYLEAYNKDVIGLVNYGKDVYTQELAGKLDPIKGRIDSILGIQVPSIKADLKDALGEETDNVKEDEKEVVTVKEVTLEELKTSRAKFDKLPEFIKSTVEGKEEDQSKILYYTNKDDKKPAGAKVTFKNLDFSEDGENLFELVNKGIKELESRVEKFEEDANKLISQDNPSKAVALELLRDLNDVNRVGLAKNAVDKDIVAKLNAIVEGKPVAPVKETYYSLGVNVRDAEDNLLGKLERGEVIENAVLKEDNYIHFTYEGKEARAHINFVSKEKPLAAFYSKGGNVRETPDTKGLKLGYLPVNQIVLGEVTEDGVWVEIEFNGRKAFIANNRLSKEAVEVRYTSVGANVRNAAGEKVGYYKAGEVFKGVKEGNRIKVDYKGAVGYVHVAFVK